MLFSSDDNLFQESGNSQPLDDVSPLNPLQKMAMVDSQVGGAAGFYMHSQQVMAPPPGYGMTSFFTQPTAPLPHDILWFRARRKKSHRESSRAAVQRH